ncbi:hypothetical protein ABEB36_002505 [Hypothenemus hampei]|uniref:Uncharacterized protein n=1 Tax=Hypothenemus hampei TaxID=57062 RepID=A0ABD1F8L3_HYPHA
MNESKMKYFIVYPPFYLNILYFDSSRISGLILWGIIFHIYLFSNSIQAYQDTNQLYSKALFALNWSSWDLKCQKLYLTLYGQLSMELKINVFYIFSGNMDEFKLLLKSIYTSSLYHLKNKYIQ